MAAANDTKLPRSQPTSGINLNSAIIGENNKKCPKHIKNHANHLNIVDDVALSDSSCFITYGPV